MIFDYSSIDWKKLKEHGLRIDEAYLKPIKISVICFCNFCKGKKQKIYVQHWKIDIDKIEYYINIDTKHKKVSVEEKY